jgi:hypothetical protein
MSIHACIAVIVVTVMFTACTSGDSHHQLDEGLDDPGNTTDRRDAARSAESDAPEAGSATLDSAVMADGGGSVDASPTNSSPSTHATEHNPFHELDASANPDPMSDSGALIIQPETEVYDVPTLCGSVWQLQGKVISTNLLGHVVLGEWVQVQSAAMTVDGGVATGALAFDASVASNAADAGAGNTVSTGGTGLDQEACPDKFAPYLVQCEQGVILITSPTMVYAAGPTLGDERVTIGCWERECAIGCVPTVIDLLKDVHARVAPVIPSATVDAGQPEASGLVRVNGVDVEAIATLEITSRLL